MPSSSRSRCQSDLSNTLSATRSIRPQQGVGPNSLYHNPNRETNWQTKRRSASIRWRPGRVRLLVVLLMGCVLVGLFGWFSYRLSDWSEGADKTRVQSNHAEPPVKIAKRPSPLQSVYWTLLSGGAVSEAIHEVEQQIGEGEARPSDWLLAVRGSILLEDESKFHRWVESARSADIPAETLAIEESLWDLRHGVHFAENVKFLGKVDRSCLPEESLRQSMALGLVASEQLQKAQLVLEELERSHPHSAEFCLAKSHYLRAIEESQAAVEMLLSGIETHSGHELLLIELTQLYAGGATADAAKEGLVLETLVNQAPHNPQMKLQFAEWLRFHGRAREAKELLSGGEQNPSTISELANLEFDLGNYASASELLDRLLTSQASTLDALADEIFRLSIAGRSTTADPFVEQIKLSALVMGLGGRPNQAREIQELLLGRIARMRRYIDLLSKKPIFPADQRLQQAVDSILDPGRPEGSIRPAGAEVAEDVLQHPAYAVYEQHCAACHGLEGDGAGPAARHLFPPPRNLVDAPSRYVSGTGSLPTRQDIETCIRSGFPGTSMPAFPQLSKEQVTDLADLVLVFRRMGLLKDWNALATHEDVSRSEDWIQSRWFAIDAIKVPATRPGTPQSIDSGQKLFVEWGCRNCHPLVGQQLKFLSSQGEMVVARDLKKDMFRGGEQRADLYRRIVLGMPGTPHPALSLDAAADSSKLDDLIDYVLSQREPDSDPGTNHGRLQQALQLPTLRDPDAGALDSEE